MLEVILCGVAVAALVLQAADFWLRWFRKPPEGGDRDLDRPRFTAGACPVFANPSSAGLGRTG